MTTLYQEAKAALEGAALRPRKSLGQNFLVHEGVLGSIVRLLELSPGDEIVEIGPGLGFLTRRLLAVARRVWAVEVDKGMVDRLRQSPLGSHPALELVHADFLKFPLASALPERKVKLVANLPYSISTPALFRVLEMRERFSLLVLMVQREVGDRLLAPCGAKPYGTLSVWFQVHGRLLDKAAVSPEAFYPRPRVRSVVLKIGLHAAPLVPAEHHADLRKLVRAAFGQRRKMLSNALAATLRAEPAEASRLLRQAGIDPKRRGETLSVEEFGRLARAVKELRVESQETRGKA